MGVVGTIIIIAVGMWFLSNLFRGGENERGQNAAKPLPRRDATGRGRPAGSDIDRFLEEINRRRQQAAQREAARPTPPAPTPVARQRQRPRPVRTEPGRSSSIPVVLPVDPERGGVARRPPPVVAVAIEEVKPAARQQAARTGKDVAAKGVIATAREEPAAVMLPVMPTSPALAQLQSLLRTTQTLRTAVVLHEILGAPRCRRR